MPISAQTGMVLAANLNFTSSRQASIINEKPYLYQMNCAHTSGNIVLSDRF
jgi:hypothetical protein